jgi:transcriptional regulator with XRE-family HTH domain
MPAERAPIRKVCEVLRLRHALGLSERQIAASVGVSRSTVAEYLRRAGVVGIITWPVPDGMHEAELERRLFTVPSFEPKPTRGLPDWHHVHNGAEATWCDAAAAVGGVPGPARRWLRL